MTLVTAHRDRVIRIGSWLLLALALLPAITYMGHWPIAGLHEHVEAGVDPAAALAEHADHCHVGVSHCAGGEAMVGSVWVGDDAGLLSLNSPHMKVEIDQQLLAQEGEPSLILQPPKSL